MSNRHVEPSMRSIVNAAIKAPSSHNTQPWRFTITDNAISLYADRTRALPANDPDDRELTISCGCALTNMRVSAAHNGYMPQVSILSNSKNNDLFAVMHLHSLPELPTDKVTTQAYLFPAIDKRRTFRKNFADKTVANHVIDTLQACAEAEGAWLYIISDKTKRKTTAELVAEGDLQQWSNRDWRHELGQWIRPRYRQDGLTVPTLLAPVAQALVRNFNMGKRMATKDKQIARQSPILAVLGTDSDDVYAWLRAGQALERVLLAACTERLQCSYLNQPLQVASLRPQLQLLVEHSGFPQILLRMGYPTQNLQASPRRYLEDVLD